MEIITTHINADFDGLASMVAAKRLYPEAQMVFAGSQEKNLRDYLAQQDKNIFYFSKIKNIDPKSITRLILVDTRQPGRIDQLQACLDNQDLDIHLYDHHPDMPGDLHGSLEVVRPTGSTATIFTQLFREKGIIPTQDEATLLGLGIYEDTGSFLHSTTTPADLDAAAWLLAQGANLDVITQFVSHDLSSEQVDLLGRLLKNSTTYTIQATAVVVTKLQLPRYVDNFAVLVRRLMVMENIDVLFALVAMGERTYLIGRSRVPEVNVGIVARAFGGGGHASAASATIRDQTLFEAEEKLVQLLHQHIQPRAIVREIMSSPPITVAPDISMEAANQLLTRYNVTVLPVVARPGKRHPDNPSGLLGIISRRVVEKAIFHKLGHLPVSDYMTTDIATLDEEATLADVQELIIGHRQRLIPVVSQGSLKGVITRTDLLNLLIKDPALMPRELLDEEAHPSLKRTRNLAALMGEQLDRRTITLLREIGEIAEKLGMKAYVVGGFVRDLLLHIDNLDIDIVIEGDGIRFAREFARFKEAAVRPHAKFATATIIMPGGQHIDVATARLEYYEYPAAMPTVELSSIKLDLFRRDFTINAMAIHLNPENFGILVDYFNSQNDLKERRIQVLHNLSFIEDPTRIFRAIRFEQRLDFRITPQAEKLMKNAIQMKLLDDFSGTRLFGELRLMLSEDNPIPALRRMAEFDLFQVLWPNLRPNLKIDRRFIHVLTQANRAISWFKLLYLGYRFAPWRVYLLAVMSRSRVRELLHFCQRFELSPRETRLLVQTKSEAERISRDMLRRPYMKPSEIYWQLHQLGVEGLLYLMAIARKKHIQKAVSQFVMELQDVRPLLNGRDLQEMGYTSGPIFREMLDRLVSAQLDRLIHTPEEARELLRREYPLPTSTEPA